MTLRIAVYGGSFDPPHIAHVLVAAWARAIGHVDRVLVIPTLEHALGKEPGATFEQRFAMCELAMSGLRGVEVDAIERDLGGPSRTFVTLEALAERYAGSGGATFRLIVGADILGETDRWYRWPDVAALAPPLVVGRRGYPAPDGLSVEMPEVSSTRVRQAFASCEGPGDPHDEALGAWLPHAVRAYADAHALYRSAARGHA